MKERTITTILLVITVVAIVIGFRAQVITNSRLENARQKNSEATEALAELRGALERSSVLLERGHIPVMAPGGEVLPLMCANCGEHLTVTPGPRWIHLTATDGLECMIKPDQIVQLRRKNATTFADIDVPEGTALVTAAGTHWYVKETPEQIRQMMNQLVPTLPSTKEGSIGHRVKGLDDELLKPEAPGVEMPEEKTENQTGSDGDLVPTTAADLLDT